MMGVQYISMSGKIRFYGTLAITAAIFVNTFTFGLLGMLVGVAIFGSASGSYAMSTWLFLFVASVLTMAYITR